MIEFLSGDTLHNADMTIRRVVTHVEENKVYYTYDDPETPHISHWHCYITSALASIESRMWLFRRIPSHIRLPEGI